ncbi:BZIP transcription factor [Penicillium ucsense]|uniref:BZIP transcription factor n=1 Tax=Penicillium ucsense TaxID=2839758 RepID=A0A8J8WHW5_9EURO|nr:BZIP transcription factor [Penicillium ucsense]KAF7735216.1 BZIP transcription factor [Penicillium ucsense]
MDSAWLESIAFSLEQFPPDGHFLGTSLLPNGFMSETGSEYSQGDFSVYGAASAISGAYSPISHGSMSSFDASVFSQSTRPGPNSLGYQTKIPSFDISGPGLASRDGPQDLTRQTQAQHSRPVRSDSPSSQDSDEGRLQEKRRRNKIAARKLRQKRADQVSDLESKLEEMRKERDDLRVKAAKWEGEVMILRELLGRGKGT